MVLFQGRISPSMPSALPKISLLAPSSRTADPSNKPGSMRSLVYTCLVARYFCRLGFIIDSAGFEAEDSLFGALRVRDLLDQPPPLKSSSIVDVRRRVPELMRIACRNGRNSVGSVVAPGRLGLRNHIGPVALPPFRTRRTLTRAAWSHLLNFVRYIQIPYFLIRRFGIPYFRLRLSFVRPVLDEWYK